MKQSVIFQQHSIWRALAVALCLAAGGASLDANAAPAGSGNAYDSMQAREAKATPATASALPPERSFGAVVYRSGGVGEDETRAMTAAMRDYPLVLTLVEADTTGHGSYLAAVDLVIRDAAGREVLRTASEGPFFLARLSPGRYTLTGVYRGVSRERTVTVPARGTAHATLAW